MKRTSLVFLATTVGLGAASGCDPVANDAYQGKVLATLHGQVAGGSTTSAPALELPPVEVALIWGRPDGMATKFVAEKVPIAGMFPAAFTVDLHHPPPATTGGLVGGVRLNQGFIAALRKTDWQQGTLLEKGRRVEVYGLAGEELLHLDRSVAADDPLAVLLGGIHEAGFHLMNFVEISTDEAQARAAACRKVLAAAQADRCTPTPVDGRYHGIVEVQAGLGHVVKLQLKGSVEERIEIVGGDEEETPCPDCETPVSSTGGSTPPVTGDPAGNDGGACGASNGGSSSSTGGSSSSTGGAACPPSGAPNGGQDNGQTSGGGKP